MKVIILNYMSLKQHTRGRKRDPSHLISILMALLFCVFNALYWPWLLRYEEVELTGKVDKGKAYLDTEGFGSGL